MAMPPLHAGLTCGTVTIQAKHLRGHQRRAKRPRRSNGMHARPLTTCCSCSCGGISCRWQLRGGWQCLLRGPGPPPLARGRICPSPHCCMTPPGRSTCLQMLWLSAPRHLHLHIRACYGLGGVQPLQWEAFLPSSRHYEQCPVGGRGRTRCHVLHAGLM